MDMERLIKILGMTGSTHDGEALSALRMAQKLMAANGKTWKDLMGQPQARAEQRQQGWQQQGWDDIMRAHNAHRARQNAEQAQRQRDNAYAREQAQSAYREPNNDDIACKHECLRMLDECPDLLTGWETEFLESFKDRPDHWAMSDKQRAVFHKLRARFRENRK
jgi:hypothetical protein